MLVFQETRVSEALPACCSLAAALCQVVVVLHEATHLSSEVPGLTQGVHMLDTVDTEAPFVVWLPSAQTLVSWVPSLFTALPSPPCSLVFKDGHGRLLHLVSVYHQGWSAPFLQGKGQRQPVHGWVPSENRHDERLSPCRPSPAAMHSGKFLFLFLT